MTEILKQRVLQGLERVVLPAYLQGPRTWLAEVERSLTPVVAGWVVDGDARPGGSKFGGEPDLPPELSWPEGVSGALSFICQINMRELALHDEMRRLPNEGMLYLFSVCDEEASSAGEIDEFNSAVLYSSDTGRLQARVAPQPLPPRARVRQKKLQFAPSLLCQRRDASGRHEPVRFDTAIEDEIGRLLQEAGSHAAELRLLCGASFFRREVAECYRPDHEIELLGFAGALASRQFGEGEMHVVIDVQALSAGELGRARVLFEAGT